MAKTTKRKATKGKGKGKGKATAAPMAKATGTNALGYPRNTVRDYILPHYLRGFVTQAQVVTLCKKKFGKGYPLRNMLRAIRDNHATHTVVTKQVASPTTGRMVKAYRVVPRGKAKGKAA